MLQNKEIFFPNLFLSRCFCMVSRKLWIGMLWDASEWQSFQSFFLSESVLLPWLEQILNFLYCIVLYFLAATTNLKKTDGLVTERLVCARIKEFLIAFEDFFSSWSIKTLSLSALKFNKINKFSIDFMEKNVFVPPCVNEIYFRTPKSFPPPVKSVHLPTKFLSWYKS